MPGQREGIPMPEFREGDQVLVKKGVRAGQRAVITEIRPAASVRLRFADDKVLPYAPNEIEPATMSVPLESYLDRKVRIQSAWVPRYGMHGTVTKVFPNTELTKVNFHDRTGEHTYHRAHLELLDEEPQGDEVVVSSRESQWFGRRGTIKHRYSTFGMVDVDFGLGNVGTVHERYLQHTTPATEAKSDKPVRLVGITGRKRAGKDTVAARLVEKYSFKRMAFADNVRKVALAIDPYVAPAEIGGKFIANLRLSSIVDSVGWEAAKDFPEVRRLLQKIGTEGIRSLEPDFWIRQVMRRAVVSSAPVVVTDVRFPNEADAIKKAGGVILRVLRPGMDAQDTHSSESAMDGYLHDWSILNTGTIEGLFVKVDELVASGFKPA